MVIKPNFTNETSRILVIVALIAWALSRILLNLLLGHSPVALLVYMYLKGQAM